MLLIRLRVKEVQPILLSILFIIVIGNIHAQGGWNIKYVPLDSITDSLIGNEVRFDFKGEENDTLSTPDISKLEIRRILGKQDTIKLTISNKRKPTRIVL